MHTLRGRAISIAIAILLLGASALKVVEYFTEDRHNSDVLALPIAVGEYMLALWFLAGHRPALLRRVAIFVFLSFAAYSAIAFWAGKDSCGCYGPIQVPPLLSLVLDLAILVVLMQFQSWDQMQSQSLAETLAWSSGATGVMIGALLFPQQFASFMTGNAELRNPVVVIDPEAYLGQRFPLIDDVLIDAPVHRGTWLVVFYRPGCSKCRNYITRLLDSARRLPHKSDRTKLAIIALPSRTGHGQEDTWEDVSSETVAWGTVNIDRISMPGVPHTLLLEDGILLDIIEPASIPESLHDPLGG